MTENPIQKIYITMIICTRNRAKQLSNVLDSACKLVIPEGLSWEMVIIDNGSNDNTSEVVNSYQNRLPIRCVREEKAGLSNARNRGIDETKGEYICWTDDDVVIDPGWLAAYAAAFKQHPEAAVFGGKVIPLLEEPTPAWFAEYQFEWPLNILLAHRDFGETVIPLTFDGWLTPWGANFSIRTAEQRKHRYNPELGVSPLHKRVGEETDVIYRIFKDGGNGWWVPNSKVNHIIPVKRQTLRYVFDYAYLGGESFSYLRENYPTDNHLLAGGIQPPEYNFDRKTFYVNALKHLIKFCFYTIIGSKARLIHLREAGYLAGAASYRKNSNSV